MNRSSTFLYAFALLLCCVTGGPLVCSAQPFSITSITLASDGARQIAYEADTNAYYILYRGMSVTNITTPLDARLGVTGTGQFFDGSPLTAAGFYFVRRVPLNEPLDLDGDGVDDVTELQNGTDPLAGTATLVINEIDYDQIGTDTAELVEILNVSTNSVDLSSVALVFINGASSVQYFRTNLSGILPAGGYLVLASSNVTVAAGAQVVRFSVSDNIIQNGAPDGALLLETSRSRIIDALSYEGSITNAVITGVPGTFNLVEGTTLSASVADSGSVQGSLIRSPNGADTNDAATDWRFTMTPTPGAPNM